jgi:RimJ/RimL family protein N-acetyltransferase
MSETLRFPIETKSLLLRPYGESDFDDFAALVGREDVTRYLYWGPRDRTSARETFDRRMKDLAPDDGAKHLPLAIIDRASGSFAGECSLINLAPAHRGCELGYMLLPDFHGRGLAVEAAREMMRIGFEALGMHRISASCDDRNAASARVLEKLGMRREGHFRSNEWVKGEWTGGLHYAMLEDEWRGR